MSHTIAIAGKGGVGKTLVCGLLARHLAVAGRGPVLAVDADPNANLHQVLGLVPGQSVVAVREELRQAPATASLPGGLSRPEFLEYQIETALAEKALAIGHCFVASGIYTVFGMGLPVQGARGFTDHLTSGIAERLGGRWEVSPDTARIPGLIIDHIQRRRQALGIHRQRERKLFDMKERRELEGGIRGAGRTADLPASPPHQLQGVRLPHLPGLRHEAGDKGGGDRRVPTRLR